MYTLLLIDGNNLLHRAYHALPPLTDKTGEMANAVFGVSNMILKAIDEVKPTYIACAFDTKAPTFRHVEFEAYKAQRKAPPPDLYPQLPKVKKVLEAFGIKYFEKAGYEADDILATIASRLKTQNSKLQTIILSGDRDLLQLVDGSIKVQMPGWNLNGTTLYGSAEVKEKFGLIPAQMVDYKSLIGDPSDNVPGINGVGPKTAADLLQKYITLENLFVHLDELPNTVSMKLKLGKETALAAKKLVQLDCNVDVEVSMEDLKFNPDWEKVREEYERLGFKSIVAKLPQVNGSPFDQSQGKQLAVHGKKSVNRQLTTDNSNQLELI